MLGVLCLPSPVNWVMWDACPAAPPQPGLAGIAESHRSRLWLWRYLVKSFLLSIFCPVSAFL